MSASSRLILSFESVGTVNFDWSSLFLADLVQVINDAVEDAPVRFKLDGVTPAQLDGTDAVGWNTVADASRYPVDLDGGGLGPSEHDERNDLTEDLVGVQILHEVVLCAHRLREAVRVQAPER